MRGNVFQIPEKQKRNLGSLRDIICCAIVLNFDLKLKIAKWATRHLFFLVYFSFNRSTHLHIDTAFLHQFI
jgi:hypothetical protein